MRFCVLIACLGCVLAGVSEAAARNAIDIKAEAAFTGRILKLSDVAEIMGPDAGPLGEIVLAEVPGGSTGLIMSCRTVEEKIRRTYRGALVFSGSASVHAVPSTVEVSEEDLKKVFIGEIHRKSPWKDTGSIEIYDVRVSKIPRVLPADARAIQAKFSSRDDFLGFTTATLSVGNGPSPEKVTVTGRIRLMAEIPVVATRVASGRIIRPGDVVVRSLDISALPKVCTRLDECVGKRARVTLRAGNPVQPSQVERMPDVCSGEVVMIRASTPNLVVEARGIAVKDGYTGEHIPVKNVSSGKQVIGTIIAPSVVQVSL